MKTYNKYTIEKLLHLGNLEVRFDLIEIPNCIYYYFNDKYILCDDYSNRKMWINNIIYDQLIEFDFYFYDLQKFAEKYFKYKKIGIDYTENYL